MFLMDSADYPFWKAAVRVGNIFQKTMNFRQNDGRFLISPEFNTKNHHNFVLWKVEILRSETINYLKKNSKILIQNAYTLSIRVDKEVSFLNSQFEKRLYFEKCDQIFFI